MKGLKFKIFLFFLLVTLFIGFSSASKVLIYSKGCNYSIALKNCPKTNVSMYYMVFKMNPTASVLSVSSKGFLFAYNTIGSKFIVSGASSGIPISSSGLTLVDIKFNRSGVELIPIYIIVKDEYGNIIYLNNNLTNSTSLVSNIQHSSLQQNRQFATNSNKHLINSGSDKGSISNHIAGSKSTQLRVFKNKTNSKTKGVEEQKIKSNVNLTNKTLQVNKQNNINKKYKNIENINNMTTNGSKLHNILHLIPFLNLWYTVVLLVIACVYSKYRRKN